MSENNQVVEYTTTVDESVIGLPKLVWCMAWLAWCGFFAGIDFMKQWWLGVAVQAVCFVIWCVLLRVELRHATVHTTLKRTILFDKDMNEIGTHTSGGRIK